MNFLRFLMSLALAIWLGGLIFFAVVAQTAFSTLPSPHLAGVLIRESLLKLHWIGLACGVVFLFCSLVYEPTTFGRTCPFSARNVLVLLMIALTAVSQWRIIPRMDALQASAREISLLASSDPIRAQFDHLHAWSVGIEQTVLVLGILVLYSVSRRQS